LNAAELKDLQPLHGMTWDVELAGEVLPDVELPDVELPDVKLYEVQLPDVQPDVWSADVQLTVVQP
jgi:hypothetical protein